MKILFDIGALEGEITEQWISTSSDHFAFCVEPVPEYAEKLRKKFKNKNVKILECAIDIIESNDKDFFLGTEHNNNPCGVGSLFEFHQENIEKYWGNRNTIDLIFSKKIKVKTMRLDTIIKNNKIKNIDFLHIDAQGNDLNVLKSLGDYKDIVEFGRIEVPSSDNVRLYKDQHTKKEIEDWLSENNFQYDVESIQMNEENLLFFKR